MGVLKTVDVNSEGSRIPGSQRSTSESQGHPVARRPLTRPSRSEPHCRQSHSPIHSLGISVGVRLARIFQVGSSAKFSLRRAAAFRQVASPAPVPMLFARFRVRAKALLSLSVGGPGPRTTSRDRLPYAPPSHHWRKSSRKSPRVTLKIDWLYPESDLRTRPLPSLPRKAGSLR